MEPLKTYHQDATSAAPRARVSKRERLRLVREMVGTGTVASQQQLVERLAAQGVEVTQATISRDISELGLVKVSQAGQHVYTTPSDLATTTPSQRDARLRRVLADYPVTIGRSGLTLLVVSEAGSAGAIGQAIDESTFDEQEGTLAGDNTILVLFADEQRLEAWLARFDALLPTATSLANGE